jgi:hypothetical protein
MRSAIVNIVDFSGGTSGSVQTITVFGGSLGGPIKKDKTFLFGNYEGFRQKLGLSDLTLVPDSTSRAAAVASRLRSSRIQSRRNHDCFPARSIREEFIAFTSFSALF